MTVVGCGNLTDKQWVGRQDPYVVFEYWGRKYRTRTHTDGGKNPSFNETINIEGVRDVNAHVWNSNTIGQHDPIGSTKIVLNKVLESGYDDTVWSLNDSKTDKFAGTWNLVLHYESAKNKPAARPHNGASGSGAQGYCCCQAAPAHPQYPPSPACGACHSVHYPPHQADPVPGYKCAPQAQAQAYNPMYQAPPVYYPPQPMPYVAPASPAQPHYHHSVSALANPSAPPALYPPQPYPH